MQLDLRGKTALVTGATRLRGIGAAIARHLAAAHADIFITYYHPYDQTMPWASAADEPLLLLDQLTSMGVRAAGLEVDLARTDVAAMLFDHIAATLGPVDILVNNAAVSLMGGIDQLDAAQLDAHYAVNMRGMALVSAEFVRRFQRGAGGRIINLTSGQGVTPMPDELAYAMTKGVVEAFTTSLAAGLVERGITVNAVDPGATDTGWMSEELRSVLAQRTIGRRLGLPDDAARLVLFLASDAGQWLTGQVFHSRGGL